jgi:hypothetical protein
VACTKTEPKNDLFLHCRRKPKQLSKKELSNVAPASNYPVTILYFRKLMSY